MRPLPLLTLLAVLLLSPAADARADDNSNLDLFGDFRFRLEQDWDSARADGTSRDDRARARVRARLGLSWKATESLTFGLRLRSGNEESHQSPHITVLDFDNNDTGPAQFALDKWYLQAKRTNAWAWIGRNSLPFWKQNEMFWDDDVTPIGIALGRSGSVGDRSALALNFGYFTLPVGMTAFAGDLLGSQIVLTSDGATADFTLAAGYYAFDAAADDSDAALLRSGNGLRDYSIWLASGQIKTSARQRPLAFGLDVMSNGESYSPIDSFAFEHRGETEGLVASVKWGSTSAQGDWLLGYWYAEIEALALNSSYAQDDWVRWGSASQTDSSDLRGHELRFAYGLGEAGNLVARLYLVEAITSQQDGNRFRLDWNIRF